MKLQSFKRSAAVLSASLCFCIVCSGTIRAEGTNEKVLDARNNVVRVMGLSQGVNGGVEVSIGSGFAVGRKGEAVRYFVTNDHCVSGAPGETPPEQLFIVFDSLEDLDSVIPAKAVYKTDQTGEDIAVLQIDDPVDLRNPSVLCRVSSVRETDTVYALGFPAATDRFTGNDSLQSGIEQCTVKTGHVTRVKGGDYRGTDFMVFEAMINPGNSGGPLVNEEGQVIGVNAIAGDNGTDDGAIYIDEVMEILDQLGIGYIEANAGFAPSLSPDGRDVKNPLLHSIAALLPIVLAILVLAAIWAVVKSLTSKKARQRPELFTDEDLFEMDHYDEDMGGGGDDIHFL